MVRLVNKCGRAYGSRCCVCALARVVCGFVFVAGVVGFAKPYCRHYVRMVSVYVQLWLAHTGEHVFMYTDHRVGMVQCLGMYSFRSTTTHTRYEYTHCRGMRKSIHAHTFAGQNGEII